VHQGNSAKIPSAEIQSHQKVTKNSDGLTNDAHSGNPQTSDLRVGGSNPSGREVKNHRKPFEFPNCERRPALWAEAVSDQQVTKNSDVDTTAPFGRSLCDGGRTCRYFQSFSDPTAAGPRKRDYLAGSETVGPSHVGENQPESYEFPNAERRPAIPRAKSTDPQLTKNSDGHGNGDWRFFRRMAILVEVLLAACPHEVSKPEARTLTASSSPVHYYSVQDRLLFASSCAIPKARKRGAVSLSEEVRSSEGDEVATVFESFGFLRPFPEGLPHSSKNYTTFRVFWADAVAGLDDRQIPNPGAVGSNPAGVPPKTCGNHSSFPIASDDR
jgi:hypothetical protein